MAAEAEAAREARAKVIAAEGEQKASRALREASEVIGDSPAALQLRYLQVMLRKFLLCVCVNSMFDCALYSKNTSLLLWIIVRDGPLVLHTRKIKLEELELRQKTQLLFTKINWYKR